MKLRDYQTRAVNKTREHWSNGTLRVLVVSPTGSGKTVMGVALAQGQQALWLAHRAELVDQARKRLPPSVQVATVQTLAARGNRPEANLLILDEAHHYRADQWSAVVEHYRTARVLGLTATPQRSDGRPLGDMFDTIVDAASYSELLEAGHIVPARVFQPRSGQLTGGIAQCPIRAYQRYGEGARGFVFVGAVARAKELAERFSDAGIPTAVVHGNTPRAEREASLRRFRAGDLRLLVNVNVLTEGVDVPEARVCLLERNVGFTGAYMQMVGRVLRSAPGKESAIVIDLPGVTHVHGLPTEDRTYSLDGRAMSAESVGSLKQCLQCGATVLSSCSVCPECGYVWQVREPKKPVIYDEELVEVYAGAATPIDAKHREWARLENLVRTRPKWTVAFAIREYKKLFPGDFPPVPIDLKRAELARLSSIGEQRGYKDGWAKFKYKAAFGRWPSKEVM